MVEHEGHREAERLAAMGVTLARAAGWDAEPLVKHTWGAEGLRLAQVAEEVRADPVLLGSRGLGGTKAVLGSVSATAVHYTARPVVVIPHPMLEAEYARLAHGPVLVAWEGSSGAQAVLVVGSRKHSVARETLLGSVALGTLHHAHRPVMVVPVQ